MNMCLYLQGPCEAVPYFLLTDAAPILFNIW